MLLRKILIGLFFIAIGAFGLLANPLITNAYSYDGKSPVATSCDNTGWSPSSRSFSYQYSPGKYISGTLYLMYSSSCKTAWAYVKVNSVPSGYRVEGLVYRKTDGGVEWCSSSGNGWIIPGQHTCYSGMLYDYNPLTSQALAQVFKADGSKVYDSNWTASY